jgi:alpha-tubulin suppressor-like RCC1 family protein
VSFLTRSRAVVLGTAATLGAHAACGSSGERPAFEEPSTDAGAASLPEVSTMEPGHDAAKPAKPPFHPEDEPVTCTVAPCVVELVAGSNHFCARMSDKTARCWGDDSRGALGGGAGDASDGGDGSDGGDAGDVGDAGDGGDAGSSGGIGVVTGLVGVEGLSAGGSTTCAVLGDGTVTCWGANDKGQLGIAVDPPSFDGAAHPTPAVVALPGSATRVDVGQQSACALLVSGEVWCWGANAQRQLARTDVAPIGGPAPASLGGLKVVAMAAGTDTAFALTNTGALTSWGGVAGLEGVVAAREASLSPDPRPLAIGLGTVSSFAVSATTLYQPPGSGFPPPPRVAIGHACAVVKGQLYCWGASNAGALGTGLPDPARLPVPANVDSEKAYPQQVSASGELTCVRLTDGTVQCAGDDSRGALGRGAAAGTFSMFFTPAMAVTGHVVHVATSRSSACALVQGGSVVCWGSNEHGELGQGTTDGARHPSPLTVGF